MNRSFLLPYGVAILAVLAALLLRWQLTPWLGARAHVSLLILAILIAAQQGGLGPGLLATALSAMGAAFYFEQPGGSVLMTQHSGRVAVAVIVLVGVAITGLAAGRRRADQALAESEERFRMISELTSDFSFAYTLHPDGRITRRWTIGAFERLTGYTPEELDRLGWHALHHPADEPLFRARLETLKAGRADEREWRILTRDGETRWMRDHARPVREPDGSIQVYGAAKDITETRRAEEGLRAIASRARCILWYADVEERGGECLDWDLRVADEEAAQRFLPLEVAPGQSYFDAWKTSRLPEDQTRMDYGCEQVRLGRSYTQEFRCRGRDGEVRWLTEEVQIETIVPGRRWRAVGVCMDVTERKQLEEEIRARAEALARADRAKDQFIAMLAHELRNPLAPIRTAVEILKRAGPPEPRLTRACEVIERQVTHQARLLDDLLHVSRIARGKITLRRDRIDLTRLARDTAEDHRRMLEEAGLTLFMDLPDAPLWVDGDATRLSQVIGNLLQNAAKFSDPGGRVNVELTTESEEGGETNAFAVLTVSDTGIGIEPEVLPQVFDAFAQADRSLDRTRGGLGVGLALVKGLVELHGGAVHAHSDGLGRGACFTIRLPLAPAPAPSLAPAPAAPLPSGPLRLLIVEDNRDVADSLRDLLELFGCHVAVAYSGPEGIATAREMAPEVVLCDLGLPGMDGYAVAAALRQEFPHVRLIAVSGYGQEEDLRRSREAGFDLHLIKPVDVNELRRMLEVVPEPR